VAEQSDFSVTIQQETPTQFIQDQNVDHESVNVYLQFGTDAKITLIKGKLDRWEYAGGLLTLHCIANTNLLGKQLPTQEVTAEAFPTYEVPVASIGTMVPLTLGRVDRARLVLIDESWGAQKLKANAELTGHAGVGAFTDAEVWMDSSKDFIEITDTLAGQTAGHVLKSDGGRWVNLRLYTIPVRAVADNTDPNLQGSGLINPGRTRDQDFGTFASADQISPDDSPTDTDVTVYLRGELRDFPWPETVTVQNMYILTDIQRGKRHAGDVRRCHRDRRWDVPRRPSTDGDC
jgi:hypothetical protein